MNRFPHASKISIPFFLIWTIVASGADAPKTQPTSKPTTQPAPVVVELPDGALLLKAEGARILGATMHLQPRPVPTLVFWVDAKEAIEWPKAAKKGKYTVELTYSCAKNAGGNYAVTAGASKIEADVQPTDDWKTFKTIKIGTLDVLNDNTGIILRSRGFINHALMDVRSIKLTPVKEEPKK